MNTIPSTFDQRQITITVMGGSVAPKPQVPVSCILLSRNGLQFLPPALERCVSSGFAEVVCVMGSGPGLQLDSLVHQFPSVSFVTSRENLTAGDMLNLGMANATGDFAFVTTDSLGSQGSLLPPQLGKRLCGLDQFCVCPRLFVSLSQSRLVRFFPDVSRGVFSASSSSAVTDGCSTLYAADWAGLYNRKRYIQLGGADYTITSEYWQKLDLFMRAWLWGEKVTLSTSLSLQYDAGPAIDDTTADSSYLRFYLKNLAPVFETDHAVIPKSSFFSFKRHSARGFSDALREFSDARRWTEKNKFRFKTDAELLIQNWGN